MFKIIKGLLVLIVVLVLLLVAIPFVVDVNDYKDEIIDLVRDKTGRELQINEDIQLSMFPWLGVRLGDTRLDELARIDNIQVKVKLMPLLKGDIELSQIVIEGLAINLITDKNGRNNWSDLAGGDSKDEDHKSMETGYEMKSFRLDGIVIKNAMLTIDNRQAGTQIKVSDVSLTTGTIALGEPFTIDMALKLDGIEGLPANKLPLPISLQATVDMDKDALSIEDVVLGVSNSRLTGSIHIKNFAKPQVVFDLNIDQLNVDEYTMSQSTTQTTTAANKDAEIVLPIKALRALNIKGDLRIAKLQASGMKIDDAKLTLSAKRGVIRLHPFTASLYEGKFNADIKLDVSGRTPKYSIMKELSGIQLGSLLQDVMDIDVVAAQGNLKVDVTTRGNRPSLMRQALNGNINVDLGEGVLKGVDIIGSLQDAYNQFKGQPASASGAKETSFSALHASAIIKQGVLHNNDLLLSSPLLSVKGKGKVDLVNERVDYLLTTRLSGESGRGLASLQGKDIPVRVKGSLMDPSYIPDVASILKAKIKKKLKKKLLNKLLGGSSKDSGSSNSVKDKLKKAFGGLF